jgi:ribose/xylose/arabinose/galactoside ABC-type transport system permease subunit
MIAQGLQQSRSGRAAKSAQARRPIEIYGLIGFVVGLGAIASLLSPSFLTISNLRDVLTQSGPLCIAVVGQAFVILVRGLDLSVGSLMATIAVMATAFESTSDGMIPVIFGTAMVCAAIVGAVNGYLVTKRKVSPFLATLAMMIVLQGLRFAYTKGAPSGELPEGFRTLGTGYLFGIPMNTIGLIVIALTLGLLLHRTPFGRKVFMVGGNPVAARLVGVDSDLVTIVCYVICSVMAGVAGLFLVGYVGTVDNWVGRGYELDTIVAAIVGGIALTGGVGTIPGAILGAIVLILIFNIATILGLPVEAQLILKGVVIILAAAVHLRRFSTQ